MRLAALELTLEPGREHVGIDVLEEQATTRLERTASEELEVAVRDRKVEAERVVRVQCRDEEVVVDRVAAAIAPRHSGSGAALVSDERFV